MAALRERIVSTLNKYSNEEDILHKLCETLTVCLVRLGFDLSVDGDGDLSGQGNFANIFTYHTSVRGTFSMGECMLYLSSCRD